jgi:uncharacterized protein (UPF0262 family)
MSSNKHRIIRVNLDEGGVIRRHPDVEQERTVALYDLLEQNRFALVDASPGPYSLSLRLEESRLVFDVRDETEAPLGKVSLELRPFRSVIKDYFTVCESYYDAIKRASLSQIEAIDMGRRSLHNEGAEMLRTRLENQVELDEDTARRLFTLLCVLHLRG